MLPIISALIGKTHRSNWTARSRRAEAARKKFDPVIEATASYPAKIAAALEELQRDPTTENLAEWALLESQRTAMEAAGSNLRELAKRVHLEELHGGTFQAEFEAVVAEASAALEAKRKVILKEDAERSAELGVECVSRSALDKIDEMKDQLFRAKQFLPNDPTNAIGFLRSVVGSD